MILDKLSKIELESEYNINNECRKIETVKVFKKLLDQIDFSSEIVPIEDSERLTKVIVSLKGKRLSRSESKLVKELISK